MSIECLHGGGGGGGAIPINTYREKLSIISSWSCLFYILLYEAAIICTLKYVVYSRHALTTIVHLSTLAVATFNFDSISLIMQRYELIQFKPHCSYIVTALQI